MSTLPFPVRPATPQEMALQGVSTPRPPPTAAEPLNGQPDAVLASPRFRSVSMFELINTALPKREALLAPWLLTQSLSMVHAWRGVGKTHMALGIAYAVATGGTYLRWTAPQPRRVLFLDGEMTAAQLQERLKAIIEGDSRDIEVSGDHLRLVTPDLLNDTAPPDLANAADRAELQRIVDEQQPALIVVDNISTLVRTGGGENDAEGWIPVQQWALGMRRRGIAVLFIHHDGKGGKQRGTSKREDVLDAVIGLKHPEPYDQADGARFIVEFEKARHIHGEDARTFEAHLTQDASGRQAWTTTDIEVSTLDRCVQAWNDGLRNVREIADELSVNKSNVSRALKKARQIGLIDQREAA